MPREIITLQCGDCKERNYSTTKNRKTTPDRIEFKKFCRRCRKHTPHKEVNKAVLAGIEHCELAADPRRSDSNLES